LNQWAGSAQEDVRDERNGDRSADNCHLVTSNRGRYRQPDLGTQFQNTAHPNNGVGSPWTDRHSSGSFPVHTVLFFPTPKLVNKWSFAKAGKHLEKPHRTFRQLSLPIHTTLNYHWFLRFFRESVAEATLYHQFTAVNMNNTHCSLRSRHGRVHSLRGGEISECSIDFGLQNSVFVILIEFTTSESSGIAGVEEILIGEWCTGQWSDLLGATTRTEADRCRRVQTQLYGGQTTL